MKDIENAKKLANEMIQIGKLANRETVCILTNMDEPLGYAIGNNLEVIEAIKFLKGEMPKDLREVVLELGSNMIKLAGLGDNLDDNRTKMLENIQNGKGYNKFIEMVRNQGGDITYLEDIDMFPRAKYIESVKANQNGYIQEINAEEVGKVAVYLGAGRIKKEDEIDYTVGIKLCKKVSEEISKGENLAYVYANDAEKLQLARRRLEEIIKISYNSHI